LHCSFDFIITFVTQILLGCPDCKGTGYLIKQNKGKVLLGFRFQRVRCKKCQGGGIIFEAFLNPYK